MKHLYSALGTLALLSAVVTLSLSRGFYTTAIDSQFFCMSLVGVLIIHMAVRPWRDLIWVGAATLPLCMLDSAWRHYRIGWVPVVSLVGMSSIAVFGCALLWAQRSNPEFPEEVNCGASSISSRRDLLLGFVPALLFVCSEWVASILLRITELLHPRVYDLYLFSFDASLGANLSFATGRLLRALPWLWTLSFWVYVALPIMIALIYACHLRWRGQGALPVGVAFLLTGPVGVAFYNILPAMGPGHVFPAFPHDPLPVAKVSQLFLEPLAMAGVRNAIPSLHMGWVLLGWWNSKTLPAWARAVAMAFVFFTVFGTMGLGEHYFVDLVVAFPFALLVQALSRFDLGWVNRARLTALGAGLLGTLGWLEWLLHGVHTAWLSPILPWSAVVATILCSARLMRPLQPGAAVDSEEAAAGAAAVCSAD